MKAANFLTILATTAALSGYSFWLQGERNRAATPPVNDRFVVDIPLLRTSEVEILWQHVPRFSSTCVRALTMNAATSPGLSVCPTKSSRRSSPCCKLDWNTPKRSSSIANRRIVGKACGVPFGFAKRV